VGAGGIQYSAKPNFCVVIPIQSMSSPPNKHGQGKKDRYRECNSDVKSWRKACARCGCVERSYKCAPLRPLAMPLTPWPLAYACPLPSICAASSRLFCSLKGSYMLCLM
jgi:hypothetical protein